MAQGQETNQLLIHLIYLIIISFFLCVPLNNTVAFLFQVKTSILPVTTIGSNLVSSLSSRASSQLRNRLLLVTFHRRMPDHFYPSDHRITILKIRTPSAAHRNSKAENHLMRPRRFFLHRTLTLLRQTLDSTH